MRPEDLWSNYPKLFHIAWGGSWECIREHGLLSTKALLHLSGKSDEEIVERTKAWREHWDEIELPGCLRAVLRDQKPMPPKNLQKVLPPSVAPRQWYELINSMVFFWPTKNRLKKMISTKVYQKVTHDVLVVDTETLVRLEEPNIRLSRMNSGSTYGGNCRDMNLFKRFEDYPFEKRRRHGIERAVAEVCVVDRVEKIREAVVDVKRGLPGEIMAEMAAC